MMMTPKTILAVVLAVVGVVILAAVAILASATNVDEEFRDVCAKAVCPGRPHSLAWLRHTAKTGDVLLRVCHSRSMVAVLEGHSVTHAVLVVRLPPSEAYDDLLLLECTPAYANGTDTCFVTLNDFIARKTTKHQAMVLLPLSQELPMRRVVAAARPMLGKMYNAEVVARQLNCLVRQLQWLPLLPQSERTPGRLFCSEVIASIYVSCGVFSAQSTEQFEGSGGLAAHHPIFLRPVEFLLNADESRLAVPLHSCLINGYSWKKPVLVLIEGSTVTAGTVMRDAEMQDATADVSMSDSRSAQKRSAVVRSDVSMRHDKSSRYGPHACLKAWRAT